MDIDKDYFIKFANCTIEDIERMYSADKFPEAILPNPEDFPALRDPIKISIDSFLLCLRGKALPIPHRMIAFAKSFQQALRNILDNIIVNQGQVSASEDLNFIIDLQERAITKYEIADGRLIEKTMHNPNDRYKVMATPGWLLFSCKTLIVFLCDENLKRLKKCPFCQKFFIAKDTKRLRCYNKKCKTKEDRYRRTYYRDMGWDEHGSISADNATLQDPVYKKLKEHWEVNNKNKRNVR